MGKSKIIWHGPVVVRDVELHIKKVIRESAIFIESESKRLIVDKQIVDTGRLLNSMTHEIEPNGLVARVGTNVKYAIFNFVGTRKLSPRPVLRPAVDNLKRVIGGFIRTASR